MQILPGEIKQASWINLPTSTSLFANGTLPPQLESCFFLVSGKLISYLSSWAELRESWQNVRVDWQHSDRNGFEAGQLVCWLKGRSCSDTAGANHWLFPPPFFFLLSLKKGLPISLTSMHAVKEAGAHCLCGDGGQRGGESYFFVLLKEDRWYSVSLSPRKCSLMWAKAAFMASGYRRDGDSRQQVLAAMG